MYTIYIADDESHICHMIERQLLTENYNVMSFLDGESLLERFNQMPCDLIITDIMMPGINGYELCQTVRLTSNVPIIMLSAKGEEIDRIHGLELGSDDYMTKPFSLRELAVKVKNMLKRTERSTSVISHEIRCQDLVIDKVKHLVMIGEKELHVTSKEFELLFLLVANKNEAFSREKIIQVIWGYDYNEDTRLLDHLVKRLRKKMIQEEAICQIETIWGYGYKVGD